MGYNAFLAIHEGDVASDASGNSVATTYTVEGGCEDARHVHWIDVEEYDFSLMQPTTGVSPSGTSVTGEKAEHVSVMIRKPIDKATPKLALKCADGKTVKNVTLEIWDDTATNWVLRVAMKGCYVYSFSGHGTGMAIEQAGLVRADASGVFADRQSPLPTEVVRFVYQQIAWAFRDGNIAEGWDIKLGHFTP